MIRENLRYSTSSRVKPGRESTVVRQGLRNGAAGSAARDRPSPWPCPISPGCGTSTSRPIRWSPTIASRDPIPTTLREQLRQLGLAHTAAELDDLIARATQKRWSPVVLLETVAQARARGPHPPPGGTPAARRPASAASARWRTGTGTGRNRSIRPTVERVLTLDFVTQRENAILVAAHFANASCAVALIDRLTHHAEIVSIERESYRKREAERSHKSRR